MPSSQTKLVEYAKFSTVPGSPLLGYVMYDREKFERHHPTRVNHEGATCVWYNGHWYVPTRKGPPNDASGSRFSPLGPLLTETQATAFKADTGKSRWTLLLDCAEGCGRAVRAVVRVLNFAVRPVAEGGKGYVPHSWRQVPNARTRYEDALHRHLDAIRDGETHDAESGESHWAHVATNALFLWELDNPKEKTDE